MHQRPPSGPSLVALTRALMLLLVVLCAVAGAQAQPQPSVPAQPAEPAERAAAATASVNRNVYAAGGQVRPAAPVEGDYVAVGGRVIVDQPVSGDATVAGASVDVRAAVGDDVRAAGGDVNIESRVGGELFASGANVTLAQGAQVARAATLYGSSVLIDGHIDGALSASAQKITINGQVGGDARLVAEQIELGPQARISGALRYTSASELKRAEGAVVGGAITREAGSAPPGQRDGRPSTARRGAGGWAWAGWLFSYLALLSCAAVLLLVAPVFSAEAADRARSAPWLSLGLGLGALLAVPVLAVLLFITLLGIPLGLALLALYPVLLLTGYVLGVLAIGRLAQARLRPASGTAFAASLVFFAVALLAVMALALLPFVGGLLLALVTLMGIGACVLELYQRRERPRGPQAPGAGVPYVSQAPPGRPG